jgi:hypothetical protein
MLLDGYPVVRILSLFSDKASGTQSI